jgi:uncharacterized protein YcbK (DUF882 family)
MGVVERVAEKSIPAALWRAQQHFALGVYSAELRASYPPHEGVKSKRKRKARLEHGALTIYYQKSGQRIDLKVFDAQGQMRPEALATFSKSLYSPGAHPTLGENAWIAHHPRLLTMLYYTAHHYGKPVEIISAFRIPRKGSGSNHGKGRAVDLRVPGVKRRALLSYLDVSFEAAGIGWYPNSTFIHLDARTRPYRWTDRSRSGQRQRNRKRKAGRLPKPGTDPTVPTVHIGPR